MPAGEGLVLDSGLRRIPFSLLTLILYIAIALIEKMFAKITMLLGLN